MRKKCKFTLKIRKRNDEMKKLIEDSKFQIESYINHLRNIPSGSAAVDKKSLLDSVNLIGEEIGFQSEKNKNLLKVTKFEREDDQLKYLNKELELLLKENSNLKQSYSNIIPPDKITKFTIGSEM
jgi:hypothetical protein